MRWMSQIKCRIGVFIVVCAILGLSLCALDLRIRMMLLEIDVYSWYTDKESKSPDDYYEDKFDQYNTGEHWC